MMVTTEGNEVFHGGKRVRIRCIRGNLLSGANKYIDGKNSKVCIRGAYGTGTWPAGILL